MINMLLIILGLILLAGFLFALHYGYKLSFYYADPMKGPHEYGVDEQVAACKDTLDSTIDIFLAAEYEEVSVRSYDGLKLSGRCYYGKPEAPLLLLFHGYKGNALRDFSGMWAIASSAGYNVLLVNQRCHGGSEGHTITFGIKERRDVHSWLLFARERFGESDIILAGVSMGAATVLMASELELPRAVRGIIADCPYDSPANIIKKVLGKDMGMRMKIVYPLIYLGGIVFGGFRLSAASPVKAVKNSPVPILIIHGLDDNFVPWQMSRNIYEAAPDKITLHSVKDSGHAINYPSAPEEYTAVVNEFIDKVLENE